MSKESQNHPGMNTPYDDAFKSVVQKCPTLALFLINELFFRRGLSDEEYTGKEQVELLDKELPRLGSGSLEMDMRILVKGVTERKFHLECESTPDGRVIIRMVQYNMMSALADANYEKAVIRTRIDDSGVLFLRSTSQTPDVMTVELTVPQNKVISYQIPVLKIQNYTLDSILEKKLYLLLPFLFFNYEKQLRLAKEDQMIYEQIQNLYAQILQNLESHTEQGLINAYEASTLYDALRIVLEGLGRTNESEKEVKQIMGGKLLEFSADHIYYAGEAAGEQKGEKKGENKLGRLISILLEASRYDDASKASSDPEFRQKLYVEFRMA